VKLPFGLRASLSLSMVGLALLVACLAIGIHLTLAVHGIVQSSADRSLALAQQTAWLAARAARGAAPVEEAIHGDRALRSLFQSALAGDPTILDLAVVDRSGKALLHSTGLDGRPMPRRPDLADLERGSVFRLAAQLLGPSRAFEARVPLVSDGRPFGEARVGISTALMKVALLDSLRAGLWMTAVALLLAILGALLSAELVSRRVRAMSTGLERLSGGEFGFRLSVEGKDELSHLASSINALGDRLESMRRRAAAGTMDRREMLDATGQASAWTRVISGLTHELADPLNAALLHLRLLRSSWKEPPADARRELEIVEDEFARLKDVLERFREFSVHGGTRFDWLDLRALLEQEVERARLAAPHGIEVRLDVDGAPERFWADGSLLRQALTNLISNSVQAMPEGGPVTVAAERLDGYVAVSVRDEGHGIPEALQPQVFDVHFTTKPSGSGIGLAVVKRVVKLHRGQVRLRSKPGHGTEVVLELPEARLEPVGVA
jgi:signal transduction histidine kinase